MGFLKKDNLPYLIAEIGGNHEGDFNYAKRLTELAISTGVDAVKFQIYTGDTLVSPVESPDRNKHFKKFELTKEQHIELADMVKDSGLDYMASVWDLSALEWIDDYLDTYKIGSGDLTAYPILKEFAKNGKPLILSTGLANEIEVLEAIEFIQKVNPTYKDKENFCILQCTSMYPIEPKNANLNVMLRLKELTNLSIGYSDHTEGSRALCYAAAMGAKVLEFHFTDNRLGKTFRDHSVSLIPVEVKELISEIKYIKDLQGDYLKNPTYIELENGHVESFRRGVYAKKDIIKGETITADHLVLLRPNAGVDAREFYSLIGKKAIHTIKSFQVLKCNDIE